MIGSSPDSVKLLSGVQGLYCTTVSLTLGNLKECKYLYELSWLMLHKLCIIKWSVMTSQAKSLPLISEYSLYILRFCLS